MRKAVEFASTAVLLIGMVLRYGFHR
jgi:hypothetical protein